MVSGGEDEPKPITPDDTWGFASLVAGQGGALAAQSSFSMVPFPGAALLLSLSLLLLASAFYGMTRVSAIRQISSILTAGGVLVISLFFIRFIAAHWAPSLGGVLTTIAIVTCVVSPLGMLVAFIKYGFPLHLMILALLPLFTIPERNGTS